MNLPRFIAHNLSLKIVSLAMASLFWLFVMAGKETQQSYRVPVSVTRLDRSLEIADGLPPVLDVVLQGNRLSLLSMSGTPPRLVLDLDGVRPGRVLFTNLESAVKTASRIRAIRVQPARIELLIQSTEKAQP